MQSTSNYKLKKPEGTDVVNIDDFNTNVDIIDNALKIHDTQLSDMVYQVAGGTANVITLIIKGALVNGYPITFIANVNNNGTATTINGKKLYKPATTNTPNLIKDKAYTVWYNAAGDNGNGCFFIKASAEGDADVSHVLANKKFSNDNDTGLVGAMTNNGAVTITPGITNKTIPLGYHNGSGIVVGDADLISSNIKAGINIFGVDGKVSVVDTSDATAVATDIVNGKSGYVNGNKIVGTATIASLGGKRFASGATASVSRKVNINLSFTPSVVMVVNGTTRYFYSSFFGLNSALYEYINSGAYFTISGTSVIVSVSTDTTWYWTAYE